MKKILIPTVVGLFTALLFYGGKAQADSMTFSEKWTDSVQTDCQPLTGVFSQDDGTLSASLTIPGLTNLSASAWSNLDVSISFGYFIHSSFDASYVTNLSATKTVFVYTEFDNCGTEVNVAQITFSRSGNVLTITAQTKNPISAFPDSFVAGTYLSSPGPIQDQTLCEVTVGDFFDLQRNIAIKGTNTISTNPDWGELDRIVVSGAADLTGPTLAFVSPASLAQLTNESVTVRVRATEANTNNSVAYVQFSLNGGDYLLGDSAGSSSNIWSMDFVLLPGTNVIRAAASDTEGNTSFTNRTVSYVVKAPLALQMNGKGTLSPNYSNSSLLVIGQNYKITASAASGFKFTNWVVSTNWIGGVTTNNATVQFMMESNLTLQVNFVDNMNPTVAITNLTSGQRVSNALFTVRGKASDNALVTNVVCSLIGAPFQTASGTTNWSAPILLPAGTNVIVARSVDSSGLESLNVTGRCFLVVNSPLTLVTNGPGTITRTFTTTNLEVGRGYTVTAAPKTGAYFTNWTGSLTTTNRALTFLMQSNMLLQANFVDYQKPTNTITSPTANQRLSNAVVTVKGTARDNAQVAAVWCQLNSNNWNLAWTTNRWTNWSATLGPPAGTNTVRAYALDSSGLASTTNSVSFVSSNAFQLRLGFASSPPVTNGDLALSLDVSPGLLGRIEVSADLMQWTTLTNFAGTNSPIYFRDPAVTNYIKRFYRGVVP